MRKVIFPSFIRRHLETSLIVSITVAAYLIQLVVPHKLIALNFFFLPTVAAAYFLGVRSGGLTALFSFLIIGTYAIASPERFVFAGTSWLLVFDLAVWGALLGLTALATGTLCEMRFKQMRQLKDAYVGVLEILGKFLDSADQYTKNHSVRVAEMSTQIATQMNLESDEIENIRAGALLHDIGKVESVDLVKKAAGLSEGERRSMQEHTLVGANIVRPIGAILEEALPIILYHHHHFAGRESQEGPVGAQIPIGARIVAVADAYDAIVTDRPYRKGRAPWQAVGEIERCSGTHFDPAVVEALKRIVPQDWIQPDRERDDLSTQGDDTPPREHARMQLEMAN